ncbi:MAG: hypothetical protein ACKO47_03610, partial [Alphaproteobacteria bacterium]
FQDFNQDQQKALVINLELMNKLKAVDSDSSANIKIKQFYEKVEKLLNSLNDPILCPQSVINRNIRRDLSSKVSANISHEDLVEISEENIKFLYSSFVVNEKIYLPIYGEDKFYREMPENDFAKFIAQSIDKPEAGYHYLPYFDENGQARLLRGAKDHSLLTQNEYQIEIFSEINQLLNYSKFQASTPSISQRSSTYGSSDSCYSQSYQSRGSAVYAGSQPPIARIAGIEGFLRREYSDDLVYPQVPIRRYDGGNSRQFYGQNFQGTTHFHSQHHPQNLSSQTQQQNLISQRPQISFPIEPTMSVCDLRGQQYQVPVSLQAVSISQLPTVSFLYGYQQNPQSALPSPRFMPMRFQAMYSQPAISRADQPFGRSAR